ncbi:MAG: hypothetical protein U1A25_01275 [Candidatus Sungbacteria bacterium]|nr:hypothetical protein [bacterium]MDZ4260271.1 hypothetical protein [Candidatus Sungbacteria bacterium]
MANVKQEIEGQMRSSVARWVLEEAHMSRIEELVDEIRSSYDPCEELSLESEVKEVKQRLGRLRKRPVRHITSLEGEEIRNHFSGFRPGTPEYEQRRDRFAREHGLTIRQVANALRSSRAQTEVKGDLNTSSMAPRAQEALASL